MRKKFMHRLAGVKESGKEHKQIRGENREETSSKRIYLKKRKNPPLCFQPSLAFPPVRILRRTLYCIKKDAEAS